MAADRTIKHARLVATALEAEARDEGADLIKLSVGSNSMVRAFAPLGAKRYLRPIPRGTMPRGLSTWSRTRDWALRRVSEGATFNPRIRFSRRRRRVSLPSIIATALTGASIGWFATQFVPADASYLESVFAPVYMLAALLIAAVFGVAHSREHSLNKSVWVKWHLLTHFWTAFGGMLTSAATEGSITPFSAWSLVASLVLLVVLATQLPELRRARRQSVLEARQRVQLAWLAEHEGRAPQVDFSHRQDEALERPIPNSQSAHPPRNHEAMVLEEVYEEEEV